MPTGCALMQFGAHPILQHVHRNRKLRLTRPSGAAKPREPILQGLESATRFAVQGSTCKTARTSYAARPHEHAEHKSLRTEESRYRATGDRDSSRGALCDNLSLKLTMSHSVTTFITSERGPVTTLPGMKVAIRQDFRSAPPAIIRETLSFVVPDSAGPSSFAWSA